MIEVLACGWARFEELRPSPGTARDWLRHELARPEYHRSLWEQLSDWLSRHLQTPRMPGGHTVSLPSTLLLLAVLAAIVVFVLTRLRRERGRTKGRDGSAAVGAVDGLAQHRARAAAAYAAGRYDEAVVEGLRALARQLVERDVLPDDLGTTAHELAVGAGPAFPEHAEDLLRASQVFDRVQYGGLHASAAEAELVLGLDRTLAKARPARGAAVAGPAVPG